MRRSLLAVSATLLLLPPAAAQAAEGEIIVQRQPGADSRELRRDAGVKLVEALPLARTELVRPADGDVGEALAELRAEDGVVYAEADTRVTASVPNDFYWPSLWGLDNANDADIDALEAWERSLGAGVTVAVVDTGINATHEDLVGQIVGNPGEQPGNGADDDHNGLVDDAAGWDYVTDDNVPQDGNGHGTHVAGTIAATGSNGSGVIGVAPQAKVLPLRALDNEGSGWMSDIAAAFDYAGDLGLPIVNASLGGGYSSTLKNVIAAHPSTLYVIAAGNDNVDNDNPALADYPCALPEANVLCVGATDSNDLKASFSNYGATTVDLSAPGVSILSTWKDAPNAYRFLNGTSMATPHAAGSAALALAASPAATTSQLKWALTSSVDVKPALAGRSLTSGRLNADAAISAITGNGPTPTPTPEPTPTPTPSPAPTPTETPVPPVSTPAPVAPAPPAPPAPPVAPVVTPAPTATPGPFLFDVTVGGSLTTTRSKLRVRYSLTSPAAVRFSIARRGAKKPIATWTRTSRAGSNTAVITRRLPSGRKLKPGRYTLAVGLNASATSSRAIRVR